MRYLISSLVCMLFLSIISYAQSVELANEEVQNTGIEQQIDSTLLGQSIFSILPSQVLVEQGTDVAAAMEAMVQRNQSKQINGFRVRIFLDSKRGAREASLAAIKRFHAKYPYIQAFRSYSAPNFKVTVGNFRTKLEAERLLRVIQNDFPDAFVVRDRFKYPSIGSPDTRQEEALSESGNS